VARLFVDTSALFKLYRAEPNSPAIVACVTQQDNVLLAEITTLEFRSACHGLVRQGIETPQNTASYLTKFLGDLAQYETIALDRSCLQMTERLLDTHAVSIGLRLLDALQLAAALYAHAAQPLDAFVTTDLVLAQAARAEGLAVLP
jgi:predicted nucleic acid-binding protein